MSVVQVESSRRKQTRAPQAIQWNVVAYVSECPVRGRGELVVFEAGKFFRPSGDTIVVLISPLAETAT